MEKFNFTQVQVKQILGEIASKEDGLNQLLRYSLEAMMQAERKEHNLQTKDLSNGYRFCKSFGRGTL